MLPWLFAAIGLAAAVTFFSTRDDGTAGGAATTRLQSELSAQIDFVRAHLVACTLLYPRGDAALGDGLPKQWPAVPASGFLRDVECPGYSAANKNLWLGRGAQPLPPPPSGFGEWRYLRDENGICARISAAPPVGNSSHMRDAAAAVGSRYVAQDVMVSLADSSTITVTTWLLRAQPAPPAEATCNQ